MAKPPFYRFAFTLLENRRPRTSLRMTALDDADAGFYELHVQKGSAANPASQFTRKVPLEAAVRLRDTLQSIGAFGWEESYGDASAPGLRRWTLSVVFEEGVFALEAKGGSDVPPGFDELLEELYRLDFPRPAAGRGTAGAVGAAGSMGLAGSAGASALSSMPGFEGLDLSRLGGLPGFDSAELQRLMGDPQAFQRRMKDEFRRLSPHEQNELIDALAATGLASRAWWERFFRS